MPTTHFAKLGIDASLLTALLKEGIDTPTPVQREAIPALLQGMHTLLSARTGSGKTLAYLLPILETIRKAGFVSGPTALIIAPNKELARQIVAVARRFKPSEKPLRVALLEGGGDTAQETDRLKEAQLIVATPGRLLKYLDSDTLRLHRLRYLVLDEADTLFDDRFEQRLLAHIAPRLGKRCALVIVSATLTPKVNRFAKTLKPLRRVVSDSFGTLPEGLRIKLYAVRKDKKIALLQHLFEQDTLRKALLFVSKRSDAEALIDGLKKDAIRTVLLHGKSDSNERKRILEAFKRSKIDLLIATDLASRGLDIEDLEDVICFDMPRQRRALLHRIGRTARAEKQGCAHLFCAPEEKAALSLYYGYIAAQTRGVVPDGFAPKQTRYIFEVKKSDARRKSRTKKRDDTPKRYGKKRKRTKRDR